MRAVLLALAMLTTVPAAAIAQDPSTPPQEQPTDLGDIVVEGRRLEDVADTFVREVGAAPRGYGLARWRRGVCVSVANMERAAAQVIVDRISDTAREVGLSAGEPGCVSNVIITATTDADAFTRDFVDNRPRLFRVGGPGMDRGDAAFEAFLDNDQPVRWWHVSAPVNELGEIAVRTPGYCRGVCSAVPGGSTAQAFAPMTRTQASRLLAATEQDLLRVFIVVDMDRLGDVDMAQLADYLAVVSLVQVDPEARTGDFATILNLFDDPQGAPGLSGWDRAYLKGLYDAVRTQAFARAGDREIAASILRTRRAMLTAEAEAAGVSQD